MDASKYIKTGAAVMASVMVVAVALLVLPMMFNGAGWLGFFGVPVIGFAVVAGLASFWVRFVTKNFQREV